MSARVVNKQWPGVLPSDIITKAPTTEVTEATAIIDEGGLKGVVVLGDGWVAADTTTGAIPRS